MNGLKKTFKNKKMKTKETSVCRKCGGTGKLSKGIMNFHNIQRNDAKEFETKLLDCIKCESCGHSWIPKTSQGYGVENSPNQRLDEMNLYTKKAFEAAKPNQKQFINFSEEHFWKYFNKFKHQDKVKMYELLKSWYSVEGDKTY